ncbi:MAG: deoxyribose-phosphate aldolase [Elusimicrobiota bacterium]|jgi:deoxyribose-phosphate aldolase|nr:deoxyribose-phosphate aldolase [Elusimicrobiota bacterium]
MNLASYIDHTLLKAAATKADIEALCKEAAGYKFASVCVNPFWVPLAAGLLKGSGVAVCTVIGFPLGANTARVKAFEAAQAVKDGAAEVDMVINIGALKGGMSDIVEADIKAVREACRGKILKVIIETSYLTEEEKRTASKTAAACGADFVKTSTGFSGGGAAAHDVKLMKEAGGIKVKASGGIKTKEDALKMIQAGADRLGTSSGAQIVAG